MMFFALTYMLVDNLRCIYDGLISAGWWCLRSQWMTSWLECFLLFRWRQPWLTRWAEDMFYEEVLCSSGKRHCSWRENIKSIFITRISLGNTFQRKFCKCPTSLKCPTSMKSPTMSYISLKCPTSLSNVLHLSQMSYNVLHLSQMSYISLF